MSAVTEKLVDKFATPTSLVILVGLIIWLVQLEQRSISNKTAIAEQAVMDATIVAKLADISRELARTTALNDALFNQVQGLDSSMNRNETLIIQNQRDAHDHGNGNGE